MTIVRITFKHDHGIGIVAGDVNETSVRADDQGAGSGHALGRVFAQRGHVGVGRYRTQAAIERIAGERRHGILHGSTLGVRSHGIRVLTQGIDDHGTIALVEGVLLQIDFLQQAGLRGRGAGPDHVMQGLGQYIGYLRLYGMGGTGIGRHHRIGQGSSRRSLARAGATWIKRITGRHIDRDGQIHGRRQHRVVIGGSVVAQIRIEDVDRGHGRGIDQATTGLGPHRGGGIELHLTALGQAHDLVDIALPCSRTVAGTGPVHAFKFRREHVHYAGLGHIGRAVVGHHDGVGHFIARGHATGTIEQAADISGWIIVQVEYR